MNKIYNLRIQDEHINNLSWSENEQDQQLRN